MFNENFCSIKTIIVNLQSENRRKISTTYTERQRLMIRMTDEFIKAKIVFF